MATTFPNWSRLCPTTTCTRRWSRLWRTARSWPTTWSTRSRRSWWTRLRPRLSLTRPSLQWVGLLSRADLSGALFLLVISILRHGHLANWFNQYTNVCLACHRHVRLQETSSWVFAFENQPSGTQSFGSHWWSGKYLIYLTKLHWVECFIWFIKVAARLISHAGSLTNLAKYPASTIQILGAEKALFR